MKHFATTLTCPHCGVRNRIFTNPPRYYDKTVLTTKCWNTDDQKGCLKEFDLNQQIQCWATPTKEQLRVIQSERINNEDRMGGE